MTASSAHSQASEVMVAAREIASQLGPGPHGAVLFFSAIKFPMEELRLALQDCLGPVPLVGCSTSGEVSNYHSGRDGISALAISASAVVRSASALAEYVDGNVEAGLAKAIHELEVRLDQPLRSLDPSRHVGLVLIEGSHGSEERVHSALGSAAPFLSFVGGSAGDDLAFRSTRCVAEGRTTKRGTALLVLELRVPFSVVKTCHFVPTEHRFIATRAHGRIVHELNDLPARQAYAQALGVTIDQLTQQLFFQRPLGFMIEGEPWLRSPVDCFGDSIRFAGEIPEGSEVYIMQSTGKLLEGSEAALKRAAESLGEPIGAAVIFNCGYRRVEMDAGGLHEAFVRLLEFPAAGFHTHGESWLGQINQTLTALVLGAKRSPG